MLSIQHKLNLLDFGLWNMFPGLRWRIELFFLFFLLVLHQIMELLTIVSGPADSLLEIKNVGYTVLQTWDCIDFFVCCNLVSYTSNQTIKQTFCSTILYYLLPLTLASLVRHIRTELSLSFSSPNQDTVLHLDKENTS